MIWGDLRSGSRAAPSLHCHSSLYKKTHFVKRQSGDSGQRGGIRQPTDCSAVLPNSTDAWMDL